jgi:hypothetical protein
MRDPVVDREGNCYERQAIEAWLAVNATSPVSRNPLSVADLVPNRALKDMIEAAEAAASASASASATPTLFLEEYLPVDVDVGSNKGSGTAVVSIKVDTAAGDMRRYPADVCCVVDVSGSMCEPAALSNVDAAEALGLTQLDLVKHALNTVLHVLQPGDRFALVAFSSKAKVVISLTDIGAGLAPLQAAVGTLTALGSTNIWAGMDLGLKVFSDEEAAASVSGSAGAGSSVAAAAVFPYRTRSLLLFTDGVPNVNPPRGILPMLRLYVEEHKGLLPCTVHTFGFGYKLDSKLLDGIASTCNGNFSFIPDASFVGTVFVHTLANVLSAAVQRAVLDVTFDPEIVPGTLTALGGYKACMIGPGHVRIFLGTIHFGPPATVLVLHTDMEEERPDQRGVAMGLRCTLSVQCWDGDRTIVRGDRLLAGLADGAVYNFHGARLQLADVARSLVVDDQRVCMETLQTLSRELTKDTDPRVQALAQDFKEIFLAVSTSQTFQRWGQHFLLSIARAHQVAQCNNFKDPGVQGYGGPLFRHLRDLADKMFCTLPPPEPSLRRRAPLPGAPAVDVMSPQVLTREYTMESYNDRCGACFAGHCIVGRADRRADLLLACRVRKGDRVRTAAGTGTGTVECVLRTLLPSGQAVPMVTLPGSGLCATPFHPIVHDGQWAFPMSVAQATDTVLEDGCVYSFVVRDAAGALAPCVYVNGVQCATLGHGMRHGTVVTHEFWGTHAVLQAMQDLDLEGYRRGLVDITPQTICRDPVTGRVIGFGV